MNPRVTGALLILTFVAAAQMKDYQGYKDPALFTRMPHYFLPTKDSVVETPFDAYEFRVKNGTQRVEGRHLHYTYDFDESAGNAAGFLQIVRNYEAAAKKIGGEILADDVRATTIRVAKNGQETWVALEAFNEGREYELNIIERQAMKQDVVADAAALRSGLKENGHVEVPGIFFDFGKSDVKPESEPALKELTAMLQGNAALKVWVVGHTDNVGRWKPTRRSRARGPPPWSRPWCRGNRREPAGGARSRTLRARGFERHRRRSRPQPPRGTGGPAVAPGALRCAGPRIAATRKPPLGSTPAWRKRARAAATGCGGAASSPVARRGRPRPPGPGAPGPRRIPGGGVAVLGVALQGPVNHFLQLRRDPGSTSRGGTGLFSSRSFMMAKALGPVKGVLPVSIS